MLFDWQMTAWQPLLSRREQLPHALLLSGRPGLGISLLAETFAQSLLCQAPGGNGLPCMECQSCNWFAQGNHPDYRLIQPDSMASELESESPAKKEKKRRRSKEKKKRSLNIYFALINSKHQFDPLFSLSCARRASNDHAE